MESAKAEVDPAFRRALEWQRQAGVDNAAYQWSWAHLSMLEGNPDAALEHLEASIARGYLEDNDFYRRWTVFQPLKGDPRLDALITRMNDRRNEQRALLDLPPLEIDA